MLSGLATWWRWNGGTTFGSMRDSLPGWSTRYNHLQYHCPQDNLHDYHSLNIIFPWFSGCGRGATRLGDGRTVLGEQVDAGSQGWHTCGFILVNLEFQGSHSTETKLFQHNHNYNHHNHFNGERSITIIIILFILMVTHSPAGQPGLLPPGVHAGPRSQGDRGHLWHNQL